MLWLQTHPFWSSPPLRMFCDPMDCSPPGSSVHGILQARILEWVVVVFSRESSKPKDQTRVSCIAHRLQAQIPIWATREAPGMYKAGVLIFLFAQKTKLRVWEVKSTNPRLWGSLWSLRRYSQTPLLWVSLVLSHPIVFYSIFNSQASQNPQQRGGRWRCPGSGTGDRVHKPQQSHRLPVLCTFPLT